MWDVAEAGVCLNDPTWSTEVTAAIPFFTEVKTMLQAKTKTKLPRNDLSKFFHFNDLYLLSVTIDYSHRWR